ncbi:monodehydroascorbate reductase, partial [Tanacetum coccineum]
AYVPVAPTPAILIDPSVSISFDHDAPSSSHSPSSLAHQSSSIHYGGATEHSFKINPFAATNLSRLVSTRKQLATDALWCFYNLVLSKVEPKNFKSTIIEDCWFQTMQDEIHEFDRLDVWELVPPSDCAMIISLKWIYKVKLDEYGDMLKNKARLVAKVLGDKLVSWSSEANSVTVISSIKAGFTSQCLVAVPKSFWMRSQFSDMDLLPITSLFTMADVNVNVPEVPSAADAPPTRSDKQILPCDKWVPVGKSNCFLDVERTQTNPIFKIVVDILKNANFFRAFTASSTIPSIYIQQFWNTIRFDKDKGYSCQLDEHRFYLTKATLRDALQLPTDNDNFIPPPNVNTIISFVNDLGYPNAVRNIFGIVTNDMYQPWRALATIINLCLTGNTSGFERLMAPMLQILWGIVNRADIDYAERIWEEFTQCIHSFIEDKMNLTIHAEGKKKVNPLVITGVRFTKLIINHLQSRHMFHKRHGSPLHMPYDEYSLGYLKFSFKNTKRVRFGMTIPNTLITEGIHTASYYPEYMEKVAKYQRFLIGEEVSDDDAPPPKLDKGAKPKTTKKPTSTQQTKPKTKPSTTKTTKSTSSQPPKPAPAKTQEKKRKVSKKRTLQLRDEFIDEEVPATEPRVDDEEAIVQKVLEESMKDAYPTHRGPLPPVVFKEPDFGKLQLLPEVQGKGKEKRRTPARTEPSPDMNAQGQEEGQGGTNPGDAGVSQTPSSHVVYAGPNLDHMDLGIAEATSQPNTEQMDDEFTSIAYPKI